MRRIFVVVPSLSATGPVKGAVALANALAEQRTVSFIALRPGPGLDAEVSPSLEVIVGPGGTRHGAHLLARKLDAAGGRARCAIVSFCLSADLVALSLRRRARWVTSVRGNLPSVYRFDYGRVGPALATGHLASLRLADEVVAMTTTMADQVARYVGRQPAVVGNFVDEAPIARARRPRTGGEALRFAFLGRLAELKQPLAILDGLAGLRRRGVAATCDVVGSGPLEQAMRARAAELGLGSVVTLHGHVADPHPIVAGADALVLPSLTEGVSRAVLESLHLGVPVVLRDVDGSREVVEPGVNGALFDDPARLPDAMLEAAGLRRDLGPDESLLPGRFRQATCAAAYLQLADPT